MSLNSLSFDMEDFFIFEANHQSFIEIGVISFLDWSLWKSANDLTIDMLNNENNVGFFIDIIMEWVSIFGITSIKELSGNNFFVEIGLNLIDKPLSLWNG